MVVIPIQFIYLVIVIIFYFVIISQIKYIFYKFIIKPYNAQTFN